MTRSETREERKKMVAWGVVGGVRCVVQRGGSLPLTRTMATPPTSGQCVPGGLYESRGNPSVVYPQFTGNKGAIYPDFSPCFNNNLLSCPFGKPRNHAANYEYMTLGGVDVTLKRFGRRQCHHS